MNITLKSPNGKEHSAYFEGSSVTIGRGNKADFCVVDESLSRIHCKIELENGQYFVTDLGSTNGVYLDGTRIPANQRVPFSTFLVLMISQMECQVTDIKGVSTKIDSHLVKGREVFDKTKANSNVKAMNQAVPQSQRLVTKKDSPRSLSAGSLAILGVLILAGIYYYTSEETFEVAPVVAPQVTHPVPTETVAVTPKQVEVEGSTTDFLSMKEYRELLAKKSCQTYSNVCTEMKLVEDKQEGVLVEGKVIYIFLTPLTHIERFATLKGKPNSTNVIALKMFFDTKLYTDFKKKLLDEVHLVLHNPENRSLKVIRLSTSTFKDEPELESEMQKAIQTGESGPLLSLLRTQIKVKSF